MLRRGSAPAALVAGAAWRDQVELRKDAAVKLLGSTEGEPAPGPVLGGNAAHAPSSFPPANSDAGNKGPRAAPDQHPHVVWRCRQQPEPRDPSPSVAGPGAGARAGSEPVGAQECPAEGGSERKEGRGGIGEGLLPLTPPLPPSVPALPVMWARSCSRAHPKHADLLCAADARPWSPASPAAHPLSRGHRPAAPPAATHQLAHGEGTVLEPGSVPPLTRSAGSTVAGRPVQGLQPGTLLLRTGPSVRG